MLDHVTLTVSDLAASQAFYDPVLRTLGIERLSAEGEDFAGYGIARKAFFWIGQKTVFRFMSHLLPRAEKLSNSFTRLLSLIGGATTVAPA